MQCHKPYCSFFVCVSSYYYCSLFVSFRFVKSSCSCFYCSLWWWFLRGYLRWLRLSVLFLVWSKDTSVSFLYYCYCFFFSNHFKYRNSLCFLILSNIDGNFPTVRSISYLRMNNHVIVWWCEILSMTSWTLWHILFDIVWRCLQGLQSVFQFIVLFFLILFDVLLSYYSKM